MTPKEKAEELVDKFTYHCGGSDYNTVMKNSKQCALIAVDEIIQLHKGKFMCEREGQNEEYWQQVKNEIEKL